MKETKSWQTKESNSEEYDTGGENRNRKS